MVVYVCLKSNLVETDLLNEIIGAQDSVFTLYEFLDTTLD